MLAGCPSAALGGRGQPASARGAAEVRVKEKLAMTCRVTGVSGEEGC